MEKGSFLIEEISFAVWGIEETLQSFRLEGGAYRHLQEG
jgi:hypothetical protein